LRVTILGAGSWGTALAIQAVRAGGQVTLWDHQAARAAEMQASRENRRYLPGLQLPEGLVVEGDLSRALDGVDIALFAIPSQSMRGVLEAAAPHLPAGAQLGCASKGIEEGSLLTMAEVFEDVFGAERVADGCFLAGPSFAREVAEDQPTVVVVAGRIAAAADRFAGAFHGGRFRVYHTDDIVGAELGGALKNPLAIACGAADGMGFGLNARAAIITRGLAEISRLAVFLGANPLTLAGLAGVGDVVLTCTGDLSRNRRVGIGLGQGKSLPQVLGELGQVAEGVITARSGLMLARKHGVEVPIIEQIYLVLHEGKSVDAALRDLLGRQRRAERDALTAAALTTK
jgi:glycerol-3-phosphate dehydrogenase (NAD(P)+)